MARRYKKIEGKTQGPNNALYPERIEALKQRGEPVNILVIGPIGAGKSTLVNILLGDKSNNIAIDGHGAQPVTLKLAIFDGEFMGIKIKAYDTTGFSDSNGKSDEDIVKEIARNKGFDLILICMRMDSRVDDKVREMFTVLVTMIGKEMWERTVVVLTFANFFLQLKSVKDGEETIKDVVEGFKKYVHHSLSGHVSEKIISEIPFCVAALRPEDPPSDWYTDLCNNCVDRCSDETRPFLNTLLVFKKMAAIGAVAVGTTTVCATVGGGIGAAVGSIVPIAGTAIGAVAGASIGGGVGIVLSGTTTIVAKLIKKH